MAEGEFGFIRDLALVLVTAAVTALLFHRLRLPLVLGYLAAGVLVGPHVFLVPFVGDPENIALLAQLGVLFLLFALGLDFHLAKLRRVGGLSLTAGVLEVSFMMGVGFLVGQLFGWRTLDALFLGAILAISSTTVIVKVHSELGRLQAPTTQAIFGILLVEDLVAVLLIALLSSIAITGAITAATVGALLARIAIFVIATLVIGLVVVPRLMDYTATLRVEELLVLVAVGVAFATSMVALALGLSLALGAFIAGALVAESRASASVERKIAPLRDVFTAVFFVSTGILLDPASVVQYWPAILILSVVTILGNVAAVSFATFIAGYPPSQALRVGIGMAMIGEFSFVIAGLGADLGVTSAFLLPIAIAVSATTTLVTPPLIRHSDAIVGWLGRAAPDSWRSYAAMYSSWVQRARADQSEEAYRGGYDVGALVRLVSYSALLIALGFAARYVDTYLLATFGAALTLPAFLTIGVYALFVLLSIPIGVGLVRAVRDLVDRLVHVIIPQREEEGSGRGAAAAAVLRRTLYVFLAVLVSLVAVAAGAAFLPPLPLLLGAALVVAVAAFLLSGALRQLNRQLESAVDSVFLTKPPPGSRDLVLQLIRERYPWDIHVENVAVPSGSRVADRRIRDLQLPQRTGATIVSHQREGVQTINPPPDLVLQAGDVVGVLGEAQQVEAARQHIATPSTAVPRPVETTAQGVELQELLVPDGSPLAGHTLAGSRIRETTGASIVGLRRHGVPILNPAPVLRLQPGDVVVLLGSPTQVAAARALFEPPA